MPLKYEELIRKALTQLYPNDTQAQDRRLREIQEEADKLERIRLDLTQPRKNQKTS